MKENISSTISVIMITFSLGLLAMLVAQMQMDVVNHKRRMDDIDYLEVEVSRLREKVSNLEARERVIPPPVTYIEVKE